MKQLVEVTVEEQVAIKNLKRTAFYFADAISKRDYESANLELEELQIQMKSLKELEIKRERREKLASIVRDMKQRGISIDFAGCSPLLINDAKNVGESNKNISKIHKKRQQA